MMNEHEFGKSGHSKRVQAYGVFVFEAIILTMQSIDLNMSGI